MRREIENFDKNKLGIRYILSSVYFEEICIQYGFFTVSDRMDQNRNLLNRKENSNLCL